MFGNDRFRWSWLSTDSFYLYLKYGKRVKLFPFSFSTILNSVYFLLDWLPRMARGFSLLCSLTTTFRGRKLDLCRSEWMARPGFEDGPSIYVVASITVRLLGRLDCGSGMKYIIRVKEYERNALLNMHYRGVLLNSWRIHSTVLKFCFFRLTFFWHCYMFRVSIFGIIEFFRIFFLNILIYFRFRK